MTDDTPAPPEPEAAAAAPQTHALTAEHAAEAAAEAAADHAPAAAAEVPAPGADETPEPAADEPEPESEAESLAAAEPEPAAVAGGAEPAAPAAPAEPPPESKKKWYVVKVQSGREESIKAAVERKVKIEGLEEFFAQIAIPVEEYSEKKKVRVTDKKTGEKVTQERNVTKKRKKFPGYLFAEVEYNDRVLYLFRETSGVGDFVGASLKRDPAPMSEHEVAAMLTGAAAKDDPKKKKVVHKIDFEKGDRVKVRDGAFAGSEGEVKEIVPAKDATDTPKVKVEVTIWGRPVPLELDYWHVDKV